MLKMLEHIPILLFMITYFLFGFFNATQTFVLSTMIVLLLQFYLGPKRKFKDYLNQIMIICLGGLTLLTNNPIYIIWAPTVKYLLAAGAILTSRWFFNRSLMEQGFKLADIHAPNYTWQRLDYMLSACFILMSIINIQVFHSYGSDIWAKFKIYSLFGWLLLFLPIILHVESKSRES
jgi:intracellular septation protein